MSLRRAKQIMVVMTLFALAMGAAHLRGVRESPQFKIPVIDEAAYDRYALGILDGSWPKGKVFYQDPFYPYFLAASYKIFGHNIAAVKFIQIFIGAMVIPLIFGIGRRAFSNGAGAAACILAALYRPLYFFEGLLDKETLSLFLLSAALWSLFAANGGRKKYKLIFPGFLLGLACLTRANLLLMIPIFGVGILLSWKRDSGLQQALSAGAIFVFASVAAIAPVTIHNIRAGNFVLITSQGGQNFYIGNHAGNVTGMYTAPPFDRANPIFEEGDFRAEAEKTAGAGMKPSEISRFWFEKSWEAITGDPKHFLWLLLRKTELTVNNYEVSDNVNYYYFKERYSRVLRLPTPGWGVMSALAIWGILVFIRRGKNSGAKSFDNAIALIALVAVYSATLIAFYIFSRYRLPLLSATAPLAGFGLKVFWDYIEKRQIKNIIFGLIILAPLMFWTHRTIAEDQFDMAYYQTGNSYIKLGLFQEAEKEYREAITINPQIAPYHVNLAGALYRLGRYRESLEEYLTALNLEPKNTLAHKGLADVYMQMRSYDDAVVHYQLAILYGDGSAEVWVKLGKCYLAMDMKKDAATCLKKAIEMDPNNADALKLMEEIGHPD